LRQVILSAALTLDGYIARPDGAFDFIPPPDGSSGADQAVAELFARVDTVLMGRKTLEHVRKHAGADPPKGDWRTYIFSRTEPPGERDGFTWTNEPPADFMARLRATPGNDVFLMGGGELNRAFLEADLVDELLLAIIPTLIGDGLRLFPPSYPERKLRLVESTGEQNGLVTLKYRRER